MNLKTTLRDVETIIDVLVRGGNELDATMRPSELKSSLLS